MDLFLFRSSCLAWSVSSLATIKLLNIISLLCLKTPEQELNIEVFVAEGGSKIMSNTNFCTCKMSSILCGKMFCQRRVIR